LCVQTNPAEASLTKETGAGYLLPKALAATTQDEAIPFPVQELKPLKFKRQKTEKKRKKSNVQGSPFNSHMQLAT